MQSIKPESYPFLRIARQFSVPYSDVLEYAQSLRNRLPHEMYNDDPETDCCTAIIEATLEQQSIRDGLLDWQTGERTELPRRI